MTTRIIKVEKGTKTWYEVEVLLLRFIWFPADVYRQGFPSVFLSVEDAMLSLDGLKKPKTKKTEIIKVKI